MTYTQIYQYAFEVGIMRDRPYLYDLGYDWVYPNQENFTPQQRPYGYSAYYLIGNADTAQDCYLVHSDRLVQWNPALAEQCRKDVNISFDLPPECNWRRWNLDQISLYLSRYWKKRILATTLAEECHLSSGYPIWLIWYKEN